MLMAMDGPVDRPKPAGADEGSDEIIADRCCRSMV
jgi:hypothetical protein